MAKFSNIDQTKISRVLAGELETTTLTEEEMSVWLEKFTTMMSGPGSNEEEFFRKRRSAHALN